MCDARLSWWFNGFFRSSGETAAEDRAEVWELCEEFFQNLRQESKWSSVVWYITDTFIGCRWFRQPRLSSMWDWSHHIDYTHVLLVRSMHAWAVCGGWGGHIYVNLYFIFESSLPRWKPRNVPLFLTLCFYLPLSIMPRSSVQHSSLSLSYLRFVSAGCSEMEREYTCQANSFSVIYWIVCLL